MSYKSNKARYQAEFRGEMKQRVSAASIYLTGQVRADVSQPGTLRFNATSQKTGKALKSQKTVYDFTHSRPGNPPFKQTGRLRQSLAWETRDSGLVGRVGSNVKDPRYPLYLELGTRRMKARSFLRAGLARHKVALIRIITKTIPAGGLPAVGNYQFRSGHFGRGAAAAGWA